MSPVPLACGGHLLTAACKPHRLHPSPTCCHPRSYGPSVAAWNLSEWQIPRVVFLSATLRPTESCCPFREVSLYATIQDAHHRRHLRDTVCAGTVIFPHSISLCLGGRCNTAGVQLPLDLQASDTFSDCRTAHTRMGLLHSGGLAARDSACVQTEDLTGDNKWNAEGHGLQDTRKGSLFQELPPVLQLHLKRFNFDYNTWTPYKVCSSSRCSSVSAPLPPRRLPPPPSPSTPA